MAEQRTTWDRIEPHTRTDQLEEGLQARVGDALWLLARQWQTGEFRGEDAATPIHASVEVGWQPLQSFRNEAAKGTPSEPIQPGLPLEVRAESVPLQDGPSAMALAVEAGLQFLRRLDASGLAGLRQDLRRAFPVTLHPELLLGLPEREQRRLATMARRGIDGQTLIAAPDAKVLGLAGSAAERSVLELALKRWRQECAGRVQQPGPSGQTWIDERLEHRFSVAASVEDGEAVLLAPDYVGGHLDWYGFDLASGARSAHGLGRAPLRRRSLELLPVPLGYAGMPNSRWWQFEEGSVDFGAIEGGPADIGRLCVAEFAAVYSDDWFLLPVRLPVGSLARVTRLGVLDTFGRSYRILPVAFNDARRAGTSHDRPWVFFELSGDAPPALAHDGPPSVQEEARLAPWLFLPPVLEGSLHGRALEEVSFLRDEGANLGWAIESTIESPLGHPLRRRHLWGLANQATDVARRDRAEPWSANEDAWTYRLQTKVPPYWIPLLPERVSASSSETRLRRARMLAWDDIPQAWAKGPKGRLLASERPIWFFEEEIPRGGIEVSRRWQLARGGDGALHLWMARRKQPGRGERGSGLEWDRMER